MAAGHGRVAVVSLPVRSSDLPGLDLSHPGRRPLLLLSESGFRVHIVTRGKPARQVAIDGATGWSDPSTLAVARRIRSLRPDLLFVESSTYGTVFGDLAPGSWIRNPRLASRRAIRRAAALALRRFDAVSFTNPAEAGFWKLGPGAAVDLPYPVDLSWWEQPVARRESWWTGRGWPVPRGPVLVCNASFDRNKRHAELLEWLAPLLREDPSAVLVLFGHPRFEPDVWEMVNRRPAELGVGSQVLVSDWISYPEIRELLAWSSLSIINSLRETQCLAVYESLAAGVPALVSAIPELTSQFPALPAHTSGEELRANVRRLLTEPGLVPGLLESSRARLAWADVARHDEVFQATVERLAVGRAASP
jgi:glycosyltransferase involved in cell wall biosynthesis